MSLRNLIILAALSANAAFAQHKLSDDENEYIADLSAGNQSAALEKLDRLLGAEPNNVDFLTEKAELQLKADRLQEAYRTFRKIRAKAKMSSDFYYVGWQINARLLEPKGKDFSERLTEAKSDLMHLMEDPGNWNAANLEVFKIFLRKYPDPDLQKWLPKIAKAIRG